MITTNVMFIKQCIEKMILAISRVAHSRFCLIFGFELIGSRYTQTASKILYGCRNLFYSRPTLNSFLGISMNHALSVKTVTSISSIHFPCSHGSK